MALRKQSFVAAAANQGNSDAPRIHTYKSEDAHGDIDASGYFDGVADLLTIGDLIYGVEVSNIGASNEAIVDAQFYCVITITSAGVVHVSAQTAVVITTS